MDIPRTMLAWPLFGAGMENVGKDGQPCEVAVPEIGEDELLVRVDALGLCFSDIKLIRAGESHPRVVSPNLAEQPVIPGHEAVMSVVKVGDKLRGQFEVGARYIIQADIYVNGEGFAYGYAIDGGMALYSRIDQRVLNGDEGCYLLPLADHIPTAIAALVEPWTCVIASYMIENRSAPKPGGRMLLAATGHGEYQLGKFPADCAPAEIHAVNLPERLLRQLKEAFPKADIRGKGDVPEAGEFDDVALLGPWSRGEGEKLAKLAARGGVVSFVGATPPEDWSFDVGSIHYEGWFYQGTPGDTVANAYGRNVRSKLREGGTCWLVGGAGAMGQMHTQLAVEDEDGPARILVTDMDAARVANVEKLLAPAIARRGVEFATLNPKDFASEAEFNAKVAEFAPAGFDDIVMLVPVAPVLASAAKMLGEDGLMNIFAGIPAGKEAALPSAAIVANGARYIGSSGSRTHHLRHTLRMVEEGKLNPATALAALGGMRALKQGLEAVETAKFPGKTVIFPHCLDMPLTQVPELEKIDPAIAATLEDGLYTMATEKALLDKFA